MDRTDLNIAALEAAEAASPRSALAGLVAWALVLTVLAMGCFGLTLAS